MNFLYPTIVGWGPYDHRVPYDRGWSSSHLLLFCVLLISLIDIIEIVFFSAKKRRVSSKDVEDVQESVEDLVEDSSQTSVELIQMSVALNKAYQEIIVENLETIRIMLAQNKEYQVHTCVILKNVPQHNILKLYLGGGGGGGGEETKT